MVTDSKEEGLAVPFAAVEVGLACGVDGLQVLPVALRGIWATSPQIGHSVENVLTGGNVVFHGFLSFFP